MIQYGNVGSSIPIFTGFMLAEGWLIRDDKQLTKGQ